MSYAGSAKAWLARTLLWVSKQWGAENERESLGERTEELQGLVAMVRRSPFSSLAGRLPIRLRLFCRIDPAGITPDCV